MPPETFELTMRNALRTGPYEAPAATIRASDEWLRVERTGPQGSVLLVSQTREGAAFSDRPPVLPMPVATFIGVLAGGVGAGVLRFLVVRCPPPGLSVPERFLPSDGCLDLAIRSRALTLRGMGRYALRLEGGVGPGLEDASQSGWTPTLALSWRFDACAPSLRALPTLKPDQEGVLS
jgi:hypothetical protein